jgi:hypothetical protein
MTGSVLTKSSAFRRRPSTRSGRVEKVLSRSSFPSVRLLGPSPNKNPLRPQRVAHWYQRLIEASLFVSKTTSGAINSQSFLVEGSTPR